MRFEVLDRLRCLACAASGVESGFDLDPIRVGGGRDGGVAGDVVEGYLVCRRCRSVWPIVAGIGLLPRDLAACLRLQGNVWRRTPIADPRMTRFVLGGAGADPTAEGTADVVPFPEVIERYGDLGPAGDAPPRAPAPVDAALDDVLREQRAEGPALDVGCGVGRGTFVLAGRTGEAVGIDRSAARVRRAHNVATAEEFLLPPGGARPPGHRGERPMDLSRLERRGVDFAVADGEALPFKDGAFRTTVLRRGDGVGPWASPATALAEAERVTAPGGVLLVEVDGPILFEARRLAARTPAR